MRKYIWALSSLLCVSSFSTADVFLICDWDESPAQEYVDYIHLFKETEKDGLQYFSEATFKRSMLMDKIEISFKPSCGFLNPVCALATKDSYTFLVGYSLSRKTLTLVDRMVVGGEHPKATKCKSVSKQDWYREQNSGNQESNLI